MTDLSVISVSKVMEAVELLRTVNNLDLTTVTLVYEDGARVKPKPHERESWVTRQLDNVDYIRWLSGNLRIYETVSVPKNLEGKTILV